MSSKIRPEHDAQEAPGPEWAECLARAALSGVGKGNKVTMVTPWVNSDGTVRPEHDPYSYRLAEALWTNIPLLVPMLRDAGAYVAAAPGTFYFVLPDSPSRRYTVEAAIPYTFVLPWATNTERALPN